MLRAFVERLSGHSPLQKDERAAILSLPVTKVEVSPNSDLMPSKPNHAALAIVADGIVGDFYQFRDGTRQITALRVPGDAININTMAVGAAGQACQALCDTSILQIPRRHVLEAVQTYPGIALAFWRTSAIDAARAAQWIRNMGGCSAKVRLSHLFCEMAFRSGYAAGTNDLRFSLSLTQAQLGECTALTAVHVSRSLRALRHEGLVRFEQKHVSIPDWNALAKYSEFDDSLYSLQAPVTTDVGSDEFVFA